MLRLFLSIAFLASQSFTLVGCAVISSTSTTQAPAGSTEAFAKLKALEGTWKSAPTKEHGVAEVSYRTTSGGNAVEEILFKGTSHEMLSVYYLTAEGVTMTHYCALGNRPQLTLSKIESDKLLFDLDPNSNIDVDNEHHIHALTLTFVSPGKIRQDWIGFQDGKPGQPTIIELQKKR